MNTFLLELSEKLAYLPGIIFAFFTIFIIHELGHYWAARMQQMKIETFSVGFGKKLWSVHDHYGTEWVLRLFPLGGHVQITDLTLEADTKSRRSVWARLFVVLAGPGANFLLPFTIFPLCFILIGFPIRPPVISAVEIGTPAETILQRGDIIQRVNDIEILSYDDLGDFVEGSSGAPLKFHMQRDQETLIKTVTPYRDQYEDISNIARDRYRIGVLNANLPLPLKFVYRVNGIDTKDQDDLARDLIIQNFDQAIIIGLYGADDRVHEYPVTISSKFNEHLKDEEHRYYERFYLGPLDDNMFANLSVIQAMKRGVWEAATLFWHVMRVPFQIFPIDPKLYVERIPFLSTSEYYTESLIYRAAFQTALLSIIIGFVNLIPFPRLDGDFALTYLIEAFRGKKPSRKTRAIAIGISLFTIYCIVLFSNLADLPGYFEMKAEEWSEKVEKWNE